MKINERKPRQIGGTSYAFVARGYPSTINSEMKSLKAKGYTYRIISDGRQCILYIGPKTRLRMKKEKLKKEKKDKKPK